MARKQLIRGVNATNVEARIAKVPEDLEPDSNIFRTIKRMEEAEDLNVKPAAFRPKKTPESSPQISVGTIAALPVTAKKPPLISRGFKPPEKKAEKKIEKKAEKKIEKNSPPVKHGIQSSRLKKIVPGKNVPLPVKAVQPVFITPATPKPSAPARKSRRKNREKIEFTRAERGIIVKCCKEYRNVIPIYLLAYRNDLEMIDSIIEKCFDGE